MPFKELIEAANAADNNTASHGFLQQAQAMANTFDSWVMCSMGWLKAGDMNRSRECWRQAILQPPQHLDEVVPGIKGYVARFTTKVDWTWARTQQQAMESRASSTKQWLLLASVWLNTFREQKCARNAMIQARNHAASVEDWVSCAKVYRRLFNDEEAAHQCDISAIEHAEREAHTLDAWEWCAQRWCDVAQGLKNVNRCHLRAVQDADKPSQLYDFMKRHAELSPEMQRECFQRALALSTDRADKVKCIILEYESGFQEEAAGHLQSLMTGAFATQEHLDAARLWSEIMNSPAQTTRSVEQAEAAATTVDHWLTCCQYHRDHGHANDVERCLKEAQRCAHSFSEYVECASAWMRLAPQSDHGQANDIEHCLMEAQRCAHSLSEYAECASAWKRFATKSDHGHVNDIEHCLMEAQRCAHSLSEYAECASAWNQLVPQSDHARDAAEQAFNKAQCWEEWVTCTFLYTRLGLPLDGIKAHLHTCLANERDTDRLGRWAEDFLQHFDPALHVYCLERRLIEKYRLSDRDQQAAMAINIQDEECRLLENILLHTPPPVQKDEFPKDCDVIYKGADVADGLGVQKDEPPEDADAFPEEMFHMMLLKSNSLDIEVRKNRRNTASNSVFFYPACGVDWFPLRECSDCNQFIYCDLGITPVRFLQELESVELAHWPDHLRIADIQSVTPDFLATLQPRHLLGINFNEPGEGVESVEPWGRLVKLQQNDSKRMINLWYFGLGGTTVYANLFTLRHRAPKYICLKDNGVGFEHSTSALRQCVERSNIRYKYLITPNDEWKVLSENETPRAMERPDFWSGDHDHLYPIHHRVYIFDN